jgi:hypothetical protein
MKNSYVEEDRSHNERFCAIAAVTPQIMQCKLAFTTPQEVQWKPQPREAATTLGASGRQQSRLKTTENNFERNTFDKLNHSTNK